MQRQRTSSGGLSGALRAPIRALQATLGGAKGDTLDRRSLNRGVGKPSPDHPPGLSANRSCRPEEHRGSSRSNLPGRGIAGSRNRPGPQREQCRAALLLVWLEFDAPGRNRHGALKPGQVDRQMSRHDLCIQAPRPAGSTIRARRVRLTNEGDARYEHPFAPRPRAIRRSQGA